MDSLLIGTVNLIWFSFGLNRCLKMSLFLVGARDILSMTDFLKKDNAYTCHLVIYFSFRLDTFSFVCVCVCERERERERSILPSRGFLDEAKNNWKS